jgi:hypothetical protein
MANNVPNEASPDEYSLVLGEGGVFQIVNRCEEAGFLD